MNRYFLLIDTASNYTIIALISDNGIIDRKVFSSGYRQSQHTLPLIQEILSNQNISIDMCSAFFIGIGPGSFTGTRVGVAIAKTFAYALDKPIIPFYSMECFVPKDQDIFSIIFDAKNQLVYELKGKKENNQIMFAAKPCLISYSQIPFSHAFSPETFFNLPIKTTEPSLDFIVKKCLLQYKEKKVKSYKDVEILYLRKCKDL